MKKVLILAAVLSLATLASARESCESLLSGLSQTLEQTQSLTRTTVMKAGPRTALTRQSAVSDAGEEVDIEVLEEESRIPESAPAFFSRNEGWLGHYDVSTLSCDGANLAIIGDERYQLELAGMSEGDLSQSVTMTLVVEEGNTLVEEWKAEVRGGGSPVTALITTTFEEWTFAGAG